MTPLFLPDCRYGRESGRDRGDLVVTPPRFLSLCLALVGIAAAQPARVQSPARTSDWYVQLELLRLGDAVVASGRGSPGDARLLKLSLSYRRIRVSTSLFSLLPLTNCLLPVEFGYTVYRNPVKYGTFYGMAPDVYVEAGLYLTNGLLDDNPMGPVGKLAFRTEADYVGLGAGAEAAVYFTSPARSGRNLLHPAACMDARLVTNFGP